MASARWTVTDPTGFGFAFRAGKKAAVRWIEQGFPAKPLTLKCRVDPQVGLVDTRQPDYYLTFASVAGASCP